jgi:hypothetical protein
MTSAADWGNLYNVGIKLPYSTSFAKSFAKKLNTPPLGQYQSGAISLNPAAETSASGFPAQWSVPSSGLNTVTGERNINPMDQSYLLQLGNTYAPFSPEQLLNFQGQSYDLANQAALQYGPQYSAQAYQNKLNDAALALSYQQSSPMDRQAIAQSIQAQVGTAQQGAALLNQSLAQMQQASKPPGYRGTTFQVG